MLILPANGSERAWFGLSARSRDEATAVTIRHQHEAFPRSFAADAINRSSSDGRGPDLRPESGGAVRKIGARLCRKGVPNKISHVLNSDTDVAPPRKLT